MIDKSKCKATTERAGSMVVIRMTGGMDCLWLNMYLDTEARQMTCDSDIGAYAYRWGKMANGRDFIAFCAAWMSDAPWLLRKCVDEKHVAKQFCPLESNKALREERMLEYGLDDEEKTTLEAILKNAEDCNSDNEWLTAICEEAERANLELPYDVWDCVVEDYTPWQKRFAEICREVIVPRLIELVENRERGAEHEAD